MHPANPNLQSPQQQPPAPPEARAHEKRRTRIFLVLIVLAPIALMVFVFGFRYPPPGAPIAELSLSWDQPFSLRYIADGNANRVWLDLDCEYCGRFDGEIVARSEGNSVNKQLEQDVGEFGHTRGVVRHGNRLVADGHLLLEMPKHTKGAEVIVSGILLQRTAGAGKHRTHKLRLWIAD